MSDRADRRRRSNIRQYSAEDQALNQISKEAETRLQAKRAARAEAREIRLKEIEKQQKEADEKHDRVHELITDHGKSRLSGSRRNSNDSNDSVESNRERDRDLKAELRELEEKYRQAMMTSATLDNEKQTLIYQLELLKDQIEEIEESYIEVQREHKDRCRDLEMKKRSCTELESEVKVLREHMVLKDKLIEESGFVIMSTESGEYKLEKNSSMSNGPVPTGGSVLLSSESIEILKEAGDGSLGTANQHHLRSSPVHETKPYRDGRGCSTESGTPEGQGSDIPLGKNEADGERVGDKCEQDLQDGSDSVLVPNKGLGNENGSESGPSALGDVADGSGSDIDGGEGGVVASVLKEPESNLGGDESELNDKVVEGTKQNNEDGDKGVEVLGSEGSKSLTEPQAKSELGGDESKLDGEESHELESNNQDKEGTEQNSKDGEKAVGVLSSEESLSETRSAVPVLDLELQSSPDGLPRDDSGIFSPDDVVNPHAVFSGQVKIIEPDTDEEGDEFFDAISTPSPFAVNKDKTNYEFLGGKVDQQQSGSKEAEGPVEPEESACDTERVGEDDEFEDRVCHSGDELDDKEDMEGDVDSLRNDEDGVAQDKIEDSLEKEVEVDNLEVEKCVALEEGQGLDELHGVQGGVENSNNVESEENVEEKDLIEVENIEEVVSGVTQSKDGEKEDLVSVEDGAAKGIDEGLPAMEEDQGKADGCVPPETDKKDLGKVEEGVDKNEGKAEGQGDVELDQEKEDCCAADGVAKEKVEEFAIKADVDVKNEDSKEEEESHSESPDTEEEELEDFSLDEDDRSGEVNESEKKETFEDVETGVCTKELIQGHVQREEDDGSKPQDGQQENIDTVQPQDLEEDGIGETKKDDSEDGASSTKDDESNKVIEQQLSEGDQGSSEDMSDLTGHKETEKEEAEEGSRDEQVDTVASDLSGTETNAVERGSDVTVGTQDQSVIVGVEVGNEIPSTQEENPVASDLSGTATDAVERGSDVTVGTQDQSVIVGVEDGVDEPATQEENQCDKTQEDDSEVKKLSDEDDKNVIKDKTVLDQFNDVAKEPSEETTDVNFAVKSEGTEESKNEIPLMDGKEKSTSDRNLSVEIEQQEVSDADATCPKDAANSKGSQELEESEVSTDKKDVTVETKNPEGDAEIRDVQDTEPGEAVKPEGEKLSSIEADSQNVPAGGTDSSLVVGEGSPERESTVDRSDGKDSIYSINQDSSKPEDNVTMSSEENTEETKVEKQDCSDDGSGERIHGEEGSKEQAESKREEPEQGQKDNVLKRSEYSGDSDDEVFIKEEVPMKLLEEEMKDVDSPMPSASSSGLKSESRMRSDGELSEDDLLNDAYSFDDIDEVLEDPEDQTVCEDGNKTEYDTTASKSHEAEVQIVIDKAEDMKESDQSEGKGETISIVSYAKASSSDSISIGSGDLVSDDPGSTSSGAEGVSVISAPLSPKEGKKGKKFGKFFKSIFK
ncbi:dentin sialophosphoprotein-like [Haliotis cracherodii]|uniref:dentin sialophosphoprotein-like n=1 Tax=Haliotis cracherodii TaxID=6455 RepID=UPI0039EC0E98